MVNRTLCKINTKTVFQCNISYLLNETASIQIRNGIIFYVELNWHCLLVSIETAFINVKFHDSILLLSCTEKDLFVLWDALKITEDKITS